MKKALSLLLSLFLLLTATLSVAATPRGAGIAYGDVNADGRINNRDLAVLIRYLNDWDVTVDFTAADVNADGTLSNKDYGLIQQYINEWDVTLGAVAVQLPENGYDVDGRGRIFAEEITRNGNTVTVTFVNRAKRWITEETSYVKYACTDAAGNVLTLPDRNYGTLFLGVLEVGESIRRTFTLPEGTVAVAFTDAYIPYWTSWA